jgi:sulfonate transport system permease protein
MKPARTLLSRLPDWRPWVFPIALVAAWSFFSRSGWGNSGLIPPPEAVWATAGKQLSKPGFPLAVAASLLRDLSGFVAGSLAGLAFGSLIGISPLAHRLFAPLFHVLRQIALFAWIPLISIWVGYNNPARILIIGLSVFYPVALATFEGVRSVALTHVEVGKVLGFGRLQLLAKVILPAAAPSILTGLNLALIYAWVATLGAEFLLPIYNARGLGDIISAGRAGFRVDVVLFGMLATGLIGWTLSVAARRLERLGPARIPQFQGGDGHVHD